MKTPLDECLTKFVCVEASGVRYFGTLIEVGEAEIFLKTPNRFITVPLERVSSVRAVDPAVLETVDIIELDADDLAGDDSGPPTDC